MIFAGNVYEAFKVLMGSYFVQFAAWITVIVLQCMPRKEAPAEESEWFARANTQLWVLFSSHLVFAVFRLFEMFGLKQANVSSMFGMVGSTVLLSQICQYWVFAQYEPGYKSEPLLTTWQKQFDVWINVEYYFILSFMAGTIAFVFVRCLSRVTLKISSISPMPANSADLLGVYAVQVQFLLTFFTPFAVTLGCYFREPTYLLGPDGAPAHKKVLAAPLVLTGLQTVLFYIIIFMRAINEVDPQYEWTNEWR